MDILSEIQKVAEEIAGRMKARLANLDREEAEINARQAAIHTERKAISEAPQRALDFHPFSGITYQCPRCWVENGQRSTLNAIPSKTKADLFRCHVCHLDLEF